MNGMRNWLNALSERERRLVTLMLVIVGGMVLWLGVWRPIEAGIAGGWMRYGRAVDANASVRAKLRLLKKKLPQAGQSGVPMAQSVAQSASDAGLTLDRSAAQGEGRLAITIGSAKAGALLAWLSELEGRGILVDTISMAPGTTPGTVVVQAVLREAA